MPASRGLHGSPSAYASGLALGVGVDSVVEHRWLGRQGEGQHRFSGGAGLHLHFTAGRSGHARHLSQAQTSIFVPRFRTEVGFKNPGPFAGYHAPPRIRYQDLDLLPGLQPVAADGDDALPFDGFRAVLKEVKQRALEVPRRGEDTCRNEGADL